MRPSCEDPNAVAIVSYRPPPRATDRRISVVSGAAGAAFVEIEGETTRRRASPRSVRSAVRQVMSGVQLPKS
jgi:hypothetical protein